MPLSQRTMFVFITFSFMIGILFSVSYHKNMITDANDAIQNQVLEFEVSQNSYALPTDSDIDKWSRQIFSEREYYSDLLFLPHNSNQAYLLGEAKSKVSQAFLSAMKRDRIVSNQVSSSIYGRYYLALSSGPNKSDQLITQLNKMTVFDVMIYSIDHDSVFRKMTKFPTALIYLGTLLEILVFVYILSSSIWNYTGFTKVHRICGGTKRELIRHYLGRQLWYLLIAILSGAGLTFVLLNQTILSPDAADIIISVIFVNLLTGMTIAFRLNREYQRQTKQAGWL